jgi:hypothetical protein
MFIKDAADGVRAVQCAVHDDFCWETENLEKKREREKAKKTQKKLVK